MSTSRWLWILLLTLPALQAGNLAWPTSSYHFLEGRPAADYIQPTQSGLLESGLYGNTREKGRRFHEGVDISPSGHDRRGEATDSIYAFLPGTIRLVNRDAGRSSYGRYIVIEHHAERLPLYSLYAHLASVDPSLDDGVKVEGGARLGRMGRSASYHIPKQRAHLHFEIGLRLSDQFEDWYQRQRFKQPNRFGNFNGMNLSGLDPMAFFHQVRAKGYPGLDSYVRKLPIAFRLQVPYDPRCDFPKRYPSLIRRLPDGARPAAWSIGFTPWGLPIEWVELEKRDVGVEARLTHVEAKLLPQGSGRRFLIQRKGQWEIAPDLIRTLQLLMPSMR